MALGVQIMSVRAFLKTIPGATWLARRLRNVPPPGRMKREGEAAIRELGHRDYVGGHWNLMAKLQFDFLLSHGLQPHHHLWDIACGSLRAGVAFINYLERGHYHGIDRWQSLLDAGVAHELGRETFEAKRPELVASSIFEFENFSAAPDFALAQSLFTHLPVNVIELCLGNLRAYATPRTVLFASFLVSDEPTTNSAMPHDHDCFYYTREQMQHQGSRCGWTAEYIGGWGHPTPEQVMMKFIPS